MGGQINSSRVSLTSHIQVDLGDHIYVQVSGNHT